MALNLLIPFTLIGLFGMAIALFRMRNQPKGLYVLFFAEMWERFSYYGMRALLVFYLTKHFLFTDDAAYGIYGAYTTLVYIMPVIGGVLADRYLGQRRAVTIGAILLVLGHLGMAIEGEPVQPGGTADGTILNIFYLSLALIVMGVGFLKANISTIVGELYAKTDPRRDGAFTLFYVGINLGAFLGAIWAGYLGEVHGWKYGFGLAGVGMLLGLIVFVLGKPLLKGAGEARDETLLNAKRFMGLSTKWMIYLGTLIVTLLVWLVVRDQAVVGVILALTGAIVVGYVLYRAVFTLEPHARDRIFAALILISTQVLFWALFEQAGSSLNIYADEQVDRTLFGAEIPASVFQSLNAFYIIFLGPIFAATWVFLANRNLEPTAPQKFGLGVIQLGLGFLVLVWGAGGADALTPVLFLFLIYLLHTTGELCLSPVGLSAMTRLSVPSMVGLIMGTWFLASGAGNFVAALIAQATGSGRIEGADALDPVAQKALVIDVYQTVGWVAVAVGGGLLVVAPLINRLMHLSTLTDDELPGLHAHQAEIPVDETPQGGTTRPV
ncbi:di-tripeptide ABC transporter-like protein [Parvularcula bermudensis HTCC2503]|uniref:Di-tripeptide ABC transporter-like protein n=1 Tax=Parvularcula bermudensis (strain ATCC BAA-594 / HTCC2503 / KCTC 12087) TaxID=314260 RepID=E0TCF3_PARBH|nr:peptide MFS transporter [Parvularcula bermudensis]ADM09843.1 di-tripeptide ABC transporter-like protein [Parvularcula bermudensis HTCC2503]